MSVAQKISTEARLTNEIVPLHYDLTLNPSIENSTFDGSIDISLLWKKDSKIIELSAHPTLDINETNVQLFIRGVDNKWVLILSISDPLRTMKMEYIYI